MKLALLLIAPMLMLTACAGGSAAPTASKALYTDWVGTTTPNTYIYLAGGSSGVQRIMGTKTADAQTTICECAITLTGTETNGTFVINTCSYNTGAPVADPGCASMASTGNYSNFSAVLSLEAERFH